MKKHQWTSLALALTLTATTLSTTTLAAERDYKVNSGDSLRKIALNHNVTIGQLKTWNNLSSDMIYPNQVLHVKKPELNYKVKPGDLLYKIANAHHVSIADIKLLNRLSSDTIIIGQTLKIPTKKGVHTTHTVKSGDILAIIARDYGTTVAELKKVNNLSSNIINIGQVLRLTGQQESRSAKVAAPNFLRDGKFPLAKGSYDPFGDTWGDSRSYGNKRGHQGTDIMAPAGTPIYSATNGTIVNFGWLELGGWRIAIKTPEGYHLYYADMSKYAPNMKKGAQIKKGQLIGYVGSTGYGPKGTSGKFDSHLHFGMYDKNWNAMNPYDHLRYWEAK